MAFENYKEWLLTLVEIAWVQANASLIWANDETPTGLINGANMTYTLAHTPSNQYPVWLYYNGQKMIYGVDFTVSGTTITMSFAPESGSTLVATYKYV